jgi:XTP/dITP diphosphohydrolase
VGDDVDTVIIATENMGKFREIKALLSGEFKTFYSLKDMAEKVVIEEDSPFYSENAMKKARKVGDRFGMCTLADDSGLEVNALGGRPGIHSSRYGRTDDERISKLLSELTAVPWEKRLAIFKAYLVLYLPAKERSYIFYGHLPGIIGTDRHGEGGFGYDPVFYVPSREKYLAELTTEEKNHISHRGRAIASLRSFISDSEVS